MSSAVVPDASGIIRPPILVPRQGAHDRIGAALKHAGFGVIHQAVTRTVALDGALDAVRSWLCGAGADDWLVLTSRNAVSQLADAGLLTGLRPKVAAVGRATGRALADAGVEPALVPEHQSGTGLVDAWDRRGARVLLPVSALAAATVPDGLRALDCDVTRIDLYTTEPLDELPVVIWQAWRSFGAVVVTSSSVARALDLLITRAGLEWTDHQHPVAMGVPTAATLSELGHPAAAVAASPTPQAILNAVEEVVS